MSECVCREREGKESEREKERVSERGDGCVEGAGGDRYSKGCPHTLALPDCGLREYSWQGGVTHTHTHTHTHTYMYMYMYMYTPALPDCGPENRVGQEELHTHTHTHLHVHVHIHTCSS